MSSSRAKGLKYNNALILFSVSSRFFFFFFKQLVTCMITSLWWALDPEGCLSYCRYCMWRTFDIVVLYQYCISLFIVTRVKLKYIMLQMCEFCCNFVTVSRVPTRIFVRLYHRRFKYELSWLIQKVGNKITRRSFHIGCILQEK